MTTPSQATPPRLAPARLGNYLICAVCARPGTGHGWAPPPTYPGYVQPPIAWLCDDPDCIPIARTTYTMRQDKFRRIDSLAAVEGGQAMGAYLDEIGKSDLAELTEDEWCEACRRLVGGYRVALVTTLKEESPF